MTSRQIESAVAVLGLRHGPAASPAPEAGQTVRIKRGFLGGYQGRFLHRRGRQRLILAVDLRERTVVADVAADDVEMA